MDTTPGPDPGDGDPEPAGAAAPPAPDDVAPGDGRPDAGDERDGADEPVGSDPLRFNQWMKRSATGAVLSGIALGLQQALEPKRNLPTFVMEAPGEPDDPDAPITLHFDPDDPTKTIAVIRSADRPGPEAASPAD